MDPSYNKMLYQRVDEVALKQASGAIITNAISNNAICHLGFLRSYSLMMVLHVRLLELYGINHIKSSPHYH